jgi:hypothetical protein
MNRISQILASALLLASWTALTAQDDGGDSMKTYVSFGQNIAYNHASTLTGSPYGGPGAYQAELGIEFLHTDSTLLIRPNVGYTRLLSKTPKELENGQMQSLYDVLGIYVGFDLVYNVSKRLPLTVTTGPSFHSWSVERVTGLGDPNQGERSLRLGWRMGIGYKFNDAYRVDFGYTMTEWRARRDAYVEGLNPSLPSYFTLKGTYTF